MKNSDHTTFYIVRHGQTAWNVADKLQGHSDIPLTAVGEEQAKSIAAKLQHIRFDHAYSSDLIRAKRTAEIIVAKKKLSVIPSPLLRERNYGGHEGKVMKRTELFEKLTATLSPIEKTRFKLTPTSESDEELKTRVFRFLKEHAQKHPGETVLIGAHNGVISHILLNLGYFTYETIREYRINNGGYVVLRTNGIEFFIDDVKGIEKRS